MKTKASSYQVILLIVIYRVIIAFTYLPVVNTPPENQDIWIILLMSIPYTLVLGLPMLYLSNKFNDLTIIEYTEKIFGKFIGKIVEIYYSMFLLSFTIILVTTLVEKLNSTMFPETPTFITALIILLTCIYISFKGVEAITRGAEVFVPFILGVIFLLVILSYNNYDFTVLLPILKDSTFKQLNMGALDRSVKFSDIVLLAMITPNLDKKEDLNKIYIKSIIYSILIIIPLAIATQAALGIEYSRHTNYPFFTFSRLINLFHFIQRIDSLSVIAWMMGNIGKISGYLYFTSVAFSQTMNKQKNEPYIIPIAIIILTVTVLIKDKRSLLAVGDILQDVIFILSALAIFIIPSIALIVYLFRRKTIKYGQH